MLALPGLQGAVLHEMLASGEAFAPFHAATMTRSRTSAPPDRHRPPTRRRARSLKTSPRRATFPC